MVEFLENRALGHTLNFEVFSRVALEKSSSCMGYSTLDLSLKLRPKIFEASASKFQGFQGLSSKSLEN